ASSDSSSLQSMHQSDIPADEAMSTPPLKSHTVDQIPFNEGRPSGEMTSTSPPSLITSVEADSGERDVLCEATDRLTLA
ncbi:hypothetical protein PMAYCL1PPCAC_27446, partial [Pristionchus mayeri]